MSIEKKLNYVLTFRIRNAPYGVYGKTETHHMVFFDIGTRNNKLAIQGVFQHLETLYIGILH